MRTLNNVTLCGQFLSYCPLSIISCGKKKIVFRERLMYRGADKSLARPGRKQARKHVRDARDFNNIETRAVIKFFFSARQGAERN